MRNSYRWALVALDTALIVVATYTAVALRRWSPFLQSINDADRLVLPVAPLIIVVWLGSLAAGGAYRERHWGVGVAEYRQVFNSSLFFLLTLGFSAFIFDYPLSRGFVAILVAIGIPALAIGRLTARRLLQYLRRSGRFCVPTLVVGDQGAVDDVVAVLRRETWLGYTPVGIVAPPEDEAIDVAAAPSQGLSEVGTLDDLLEVIDRTEARAVIFTTGSVRRGREFNEMARKLEGHRAQMVVVPAMTDISSQRIHVTPVAGLPLMHVGKPQAERSLRFTKRAFDVIGALLLLVILSPLMLATALLIKVGDGGSVLFQQHRIGVGGKPFKLFKFRSMVPDAEQIRADTLEDSNESDGALFKIREDPRITPIGRFIRRFSIDELPQLLNVLRGEMSLVGPRPALEREVEQYRQYVRRRLDVRPGMTGLWQVSGRSDLGWDDTVRLDLYYVDNWSMLQDLVILLRTFRAVVRSQGAY
ncbi:sugar transferase [Tessaracoccus sp. Z1128]